MSAYSYEMIRENERLPARFGVVRTPYMTFPAHWHKYIEILYLISGKMTAVIQAETYELSPGDIVIINAEDIHMTRTTAEVTEYVLLQISAPQIAAFFPDLGQIRFDTRISGCQYEEGVIKELIEIYERKEEGYPLLFSARLYELIYCLYCRHARGIPHTDMTNAQRNFVKIAKILDWVQNHYKESLGIDEAAGYLGFSREYFCRIFKRHTGQTFLEYVNGVRAMKFYEELIRSDQSITVLMERHGITNYKVFLHTFRKLYGDTPQKIRSRKQQDRLTDSLLFQPSADDSTHTGEEQNAGA